LLLLLLMSVPSVTFAQLAWEKVTIPDSTNLYSLLVSPHGFLFINSLSKTEGLYRSSDDGRTWVHLSSKGIRVIDSSGNIYSSDQYSSDDGDTWVTGHHITPSYSNALIEAGRDTLFLLDGGPSVYQSTDQAISWSKTGFFSNGADMFWNKGFASPDGHVYGALQFDNSTHLVNSNSSDFFVRTDFFGAVDNSPIQWAVFDDEGFGYGTQTGYLLRSSNNGLYWQPIDSAHGSPRHTYWGPYGVIHPKGIVAVTDTESVISFDHAATWSTIGKGIPDIENQYHKFITSRNGTIFMITDTFLYRTSYYASISLPNQNSKPCIALYDGSKDIISIVGTEKNAELLVGVYDLLGRRVCSTRGNEVTAQGLSSGIYVIRIQYPKAEITLKCLINK
ncbi:MAG TPA: T9SS type A sorting domain-containing protein, partial [Candidatus Kapabacteria bacterium]|nr:T9SS type A sorting domain-containing protein [Candidatus Kapabacteria bacterium]